MSSNGGSNYRWVMRAYPADYRQAVGDELVDTANALSGNRWSLRQSAGLLTGGLRTRERLESNGDWRRAAARGFGIALLLGHLSVALAAGLFVSNAIPTQGFIVDGNIGIVGAFAGVSALSVLLLTRSTGKTTLATIGVLEIALSLAALLNSATVGLSQLVPLAALWFIGKHGDGKPALSKPLVAILAALLIGFAFTISEPFAPVAVRPALILFGIALIRLRPSLAFAAALTVTFNPFVVGSFNYGIGVFALIAGVVGYFAYRNVDQERPTAEV